MIEKYASIIESRNDVQGFLGSMEVCLKCESDAEYSQFISNRLIGSEEKIKLIMDVASLLGRKPTVYFENFLRLLALNSQLNIIGQIYLALLKNKELSMGTYRGVVYSREPIDDLVIKKYEKLLSDKLGKTIRLDSSTSLNPEIRVKIESLGYEIVVSNEIIKNKIKEFIVKAI